MPYSGGELYRNREREQFAVNYNRRFVERNSPRFSNYHKFLLGGTVTYLGNKAWNWMSRRRGTPPALVTPVKKALRTEDPTQVPTVSPVKPGLMEVEFEPADPQQFVPAAFGRKFWKNVVVAQEGRKKKRRFKKAGHRYH